MENRESTKGMWKRTLTIFKGVSIPWHLYFLQVIFGVIATKVSLLYIPYETKLKTGTFDSMSILWLYMIFMLLAILANIVSRVFTFYAESIVGRNMQNKMLHHSLRIPIREMEKDPGRIVSWITTDCYSADGLITAVVGFITGIASAIMSMEYLGDINKAFMIVIPIVLVYIILCTWIEGKLLFLRQRRGIRAASELTAYMSEHLSNFLQIKQMHSEKEELTRGKKAIENMYRADIYQACLTLINSLFSGSLTTVISIVVFVIGVPLVRSGGLEINELVIFESVIQLVYSLFSSIPALYTNFMYYNGQLFYIASHLAIEEEELKRKKGMDLPDNDITFKNVSFSYEEGNDVLKNVSFTLEKEKCTLLAGQNGSGKSTLFKLFERFYEPDQGEILFGDENVEDLHLDEWRQCFAYVSQEPQLFDGTISENIAFGMHREVSQAEIEHAAKLAKCDEFISQYEEGYNFEIGDMGCHLSGGQRQRIAIARAILTDPAYLLLDEATCNIDAENEKEVTDALLNLMKGRTTLMISHNMSMLDRVDNVIVLNNGEVEASGTKEEVLATSQTLQQLVEVS